MLRPATPLASWSLRSVGQQSPRRLVPALRLLKVGWALAQPVVLARRTPLRLRMRLVLLVVRELPQQLELVLYRPLVLPVVLQSRMKTDSPFSMRTGYRSMMAIL